MNREDSFLKRYSSNLLRISQQWMIRSLCRSIGDRSGSRSFFIASGATLTRDDVAKGFEAPGNSISALGQKIGQHQEGIAVGPWCLTPVLSTHQNLNILKGLSS